MNFADAQLGDRRRTARLVAVADALLRHPGGSLPQKFRSPCELEALYHLMRCDKVTHESVLQPHRQRMLTQLEQADRPVLVVHDTTELDFTTHESLAELGQIGNGKRRGYLCHNALVVDPETKQTLGLANQILHRRATVKQGETQAQRRERESRESRLWLRGTERLPACENVVDICDRGADTFEFLEHETHSGRRFVIRSSADRAIQTGHAPQASRSRLHKFARSLQAISSHAVKVVARTIAKKPKRKGRTRHVQRTKRTANLSVSAAPVLVLAPTSKNGHHGNNPLALWIVRVWEANPTQGEEPLEWFLLTNRVITTPDEALQVVTWYECRWVIEEYHKAMKTGCGIENPQFTYEERLQPMIALQSIVAVMLLNLRDLSRREDAKTCPATDVLGKDYVQVLCAWRHKSVKEDWTIHDFCFALARLGGHQNRKSDRQPGWLVLWRGWSNLQRMAEGAHAQKLLQRCA